MDDGWCGVVWCGASVFRVLMNGRIDWDSEGIRRGLLIDYWM
jgi:hypothetical protein